MGWRENFYDAKKHLSVADHMTYVSFALLKENRLMIKIMHELYLAANFLVKALLLYDYEFKRIKLYRDPKLNMKIFREKVASRYMGKENFNFIIDILNMEKKHRDSPLEFVRNDKFVMMLGEEYEVLTIDKIKAFLNGMKRVIRNIALE